jgi:uncharacterized protein YkwD
MVPHPAVDVAAVLDPATAAALISAFRKSAGLPPVTLDPTLMAIASAQAKKMAGSNSLSHGNFSRRLQVGGYDAAVAAENIGAGYHNLNEAFAGWRASPHHRANMLKKDVTKMGIAVAYNKSSKFKDFWSLVLARPDERPPLGGPTAGPPIAATMQ